jgi:hypothetical protein
VRFRGVHWLYLKGVSRDSQGIYYAPRDEFMPQLSEFQIEAW